MFNECCIFFGCLFLLDCYLECVVVFVLAVYECQLPKEFHARTRWVLVTAYFRIRKYAYQTYWNSTHTQIQIIRMLHRISNATRWFGTYFSEKHASVSCQRFKFQFIFMLMCDWVPLFCLDSNFKCCENFSLHRIVICFQFHIHVTPRDAITF